MRLLHHFTYSFLLILLHLFLIPFTGQAQDVIRTVTSVRIDTPPELDGLLTDDVWETAPVADGFRQLEPVRGAPATQITEARLLYDNEYLYVGIRCLGPSVRAQVTRRDQLEKSDDSVTLLLDTYGDSRSAYLFQANPLGTQTDARLSDGGVAEKRDTQWDGEWECTTARFEGGWSVEYRIAFRNLRYTAPQKQNWGINIGRYIAANLEMVWWSGRVTHDLRVAEGGILEGLEIKERRSNFHVIPYGTLRHERLTQQDVSGRWDRDFGGDIRYEPTSNLTANLTYNPDFASVEGDKEEINLTRFELSFPEKRPYFLEGSELFRNRIQAFYTRRIGDIIGGGKITGKVGNYNIAALSVQTRHSSDNQFTSADESLPEANVSVFRLKRDILKSSTIGVMAINREWSHGSNRVLGLDAVLNLPRFWYGTAQFVIGGPDHIKQSVGWFVRMEKRTQIYDYHLRVTSLGREFRDNVNPVGFITDDDRRELDAAGRYTWWKKKSGVEFIEWDSNYNAYWSHSGRLRNFDVRQSLEGYFTNRLSLKGFYHYEYKWYDEGFYNNIKRLTLGHNTREWSAKSIQYEMGRNYDRDYQLTTVTTNMKASDALSLEYSLRRLHFDPDPENESTWINVLVANYQFTPDLYLRLFTQNNAKNDRFYVYGLAGWRFKPPYGALYLVYTDDRFDTMVPNEFDGMLSPHKERNRVLFIKFSHSLDM
jgi:hypothetical protein